MAGHGATIVPGVLPPTVTVVLAPPATADGRCLEAAFATAECVQKAGSLDTTCRQTTP